MPTPTAYSALGRLAVALALGAGPLVGHAQEGGAAWSGEQEAMSYDFLLAISEPADFDPAEDVSAELPIERDIQGASQSAAERLAASERPADVASETRGGAVKLGAVDYTVAIRLAEGFAEAALLDEIAGSHIEVILPPVDLPMVDLVSGATMYRLLGDDAGAAVWYARLTEVSDDPLNYFFYARALRALGHDDLADDYAARYAAARKRS